MIANTVAEVQTGKRVRRTRSAAREQMLDAAEELLRVGGPDAVRVQRVARAVGVSDAAVHYHFESRDALLDTLLRRTGRRLRAQLAATLRRQRESGAPLDLTALARDLHAVFADAGYSRLTAWMLLSGFTPTGSGMLREAGEILHEERRASSRQRDQATAGLDDTLATLTLLTLAAWAEPLAGDAWRAASGLTDTRPGAFLEWIARVLSQHLEVGEAATRHQSPEHAAK
jgi:TetR/AcrR family transcriptional regulator, repressor for neighboring sulfatase